MKKTKAIYEQLEFGDCPEEDDAVKPEADTVLDMSSPLYDATDENADCWKSVDFDAVGNDAAEGTPDDTGSGGSDLPPPNHFKWSMDDDAPDPEQSRSTSGAPLMWLTKLNSEHSEHSERSETFSSTDFEDPDWISPIYPESLWKSLDNPDLGEIFYDEAVSRDIVKITFLNSCFVAQFTILLANLHLHHNDWYAYSEMNGAWCQLNKPKLRNIIHRAIVFLGRKMEILDFLAFCKPSYFNGVIGMMVPFPEYENIFDHAPKYVINVKNGTLVIDSDGNVVMHEHSPEFLCRNTININYDPTVDYTDFVKEMFGDHVSPEDIDVMQKYAGQCLFGWNVSQTILLISGEAGTGKSNIVRLLEMILGRGNYEGLRTSMLDRPFETSRFEGKSLLVASDQYSDALMKKGAHMLKTLTGGDEGTTERKGENEHAMIKGVFNVIMVSNPDLALSLDDDHVAWARRIRPVKYVGEAPRDPDRLFVEHMLAKNSKQILKWMVDGAIALRGDGDKINPPPEMALRIDELIQEADACYAFVKNCVIRTRLTVDVLLSSTLYNAFTSSNYFIGEANKQTIQKGLKKAMKDVYGIKKPRQDLPGPDGKAKYSYVGFRIEWNDPD